MFKEMKVLKTINVSFIIEKPDLDEYDLEVVPVQAREGKDQYFRALKQAIPFIEDLCDENGWTVIDHHESTMKEFATEPENGGDENVCNVCHFTAEFCPIYGTKCEKLLPVPVCRKASEVVDDEEVDWEAMKSEQRERQNNCGYPEV